jgi:multidrug efflux pump subunit AcrA (membrane-fusion protein)
VIVSPVRGTVIARNVSVGQTVAASFTTPTLFTIAQDLTKMEVDIAAGEPDVGGVHAGEAADFTVLAFPNRTFTGTVYQVRRNPTALNNVVTYDTVVYVQNGDGALFPGMTANANIHVAKVANALVVPLQALQWAPHVASSAAGGSGAAPASAWGTTTASLSRTVVAGRNARLFVLENNVPRAVNVRILLVSGTQAAVAPIAGLLGTTDRIVISDSSQNTATKATPAVTSLAPAASAARPTTH